MFSGGGLVAVDLSSGRVPWTADGGDPVMGGKAAIVDLCSLHEAALLLVRNRGGGDFDVLVPNRSTSNFYSQDTGER